MPAFPLRSALCSFVLCFALAGCGGSMYKSPDIQQVDEKTGKTSTVSDTEELEAGIIRAFPDIPFPATHKIDLEHSVIFNSPTQTMGKVVLVGKEDADSLFRFYEKNMKTKGWSLVNSFQSSVSSMYFAKPGKFVAVIINMHTGEVYLNIGPE